MGRDPPVTAAVLSAGVLRLVAADLVSREPDPQDRRSSWVRLASSGVKLAEAVVRDVAAAHKRLLAPLEPAAGRELADLLRDTLNTLDDQRR